jgi:hypothetical protein
MGVFNFMKSGAQKKAEKKTKQTKKAIESVQARMTLERGSVGGKKGSSAGELHQRAAQDIALYPDKKRGKPRTTQIGKYR